MVTQYYIVTNHDIIRLAIQEHNDNKIIKISTKEQIRVHF